MGFYRLHYGIREIIENQTSNVFFLIRRAMRLHLRRIDSARMRYDDNFLEEKNLKKLRII